MPPCKYMKCTLPPGKICPNAPLKIPKIKDASVKKYAVPNKKENSTKTSKNKKVKSLGLCPCCEDLICACCRVEYSEQQKQYQQQEQQEQQQQQDQSKQDQQYEQQLDQQQYEKQRQQQYQSQRFQKQQPYQQQQSYEQQPYQQQPYQQQQQFQQQRFQQQQQFQQQSYPQQHQYQQQLHLQQQKPQEMKVLTRELPLYDDNCHLLGYLGIGTIIKGPYCPKSNEPFLEEASEHMGKTNGCPPECMQAIREGRCDSIAFPRWVPRNQYVMGTRNL